MPLKKRLSCIGMIMPINPDRPLRNPLAWRLMVYLCVKASSRTRVAVASAILRCCQLPFSTALTVDADTPASSARSWMVNLRLFIGGRPRRRQWDHYLEGDRVASSDRRWHNRLRKVSLSRATRQEFRKRGRRQRRRVVQVDALEEEDPLGQQ